MPKTELMLLWLVLGLADAAHVIEETARHNLPPIPFIFWLVWFIITVVIETIWFRKIKSKEV